MPRRRSSNSSHAEAVELAIPGGEIAQRRHGLVVELGDRRAARGPVRRAHLAERRRLQRVCEQLDRFDHALGEAHALALGKMCLGAREIVARDRDPVGVRVVEALVHVAGCQERHLEIAEVTGRGRLRVPDEFGERHPGRRSEVACPRGACQPGIGGEAGGPRLTLHVVESGNRPIDRIAQERHHERPPGKAIDERIRHVSMDESVAPDGGQLLRTLLARVAPEERENVRRRKPAREQLTQRSARGLGDVEEEERAVAECLHAGPYRERSEPFDSPNRVRSLRARRPYRGAQAPGPPDKAIAGRTTSSICWTQAAIDCVSVRRTILSRAWRLVRVRHSRDAGDSAVAGRGIQSLRIAGGADAHRRIQVHLDERNRGRAPGYQLACVFAILEYRDTKAQRTTEPAWATSLATCAARRMFSERSAAEKPRSELSPRRNSSPSSTHTEQRRSNRARSRWVASVDFPELGSPVSQTTTALCPLRATRSSPLTDRGARSAVSVETARVIGGTFSPAGRTPER